jgi:hypothetical protein
LIGGGFTRNDAGIPLLDAATGLYIAGDANYDYGSIVPRLTGDSRAFLPIKISFAISVLITRAAVNFMP